MIGSSLVARWGAIGAGVTLSGLARSRGLRHWALSVLAGLALGMTLGTAAWLALAEGPTRPPEQVVVTIPMGTAERIAAGAPAPAIPAEVRLIEGDTLVLQNLDTVAHQLGGDTVAPGATLRVAARATDRGSFLCTFHARGSISLDVRGRSEPLGVVAPTLLLGLPIGLVLGSVGWIVRRLDDPGDTVLAPPRERLDPQS